MPYLLGFIFVLFVIYNVLVEKLKLTSDAAIGAIILTPFALWFLSFIISQIKEANQIANKKRKEREYEKRQQEEREESRIQWIKQEKNNLISIITSSENELNKLPSLISDAEQHLDRAEYEFSDGAFAPFWDEIEHATNKLAAYRQNINQLTRNTEDYDRRAKQLTVKVPDFKLPLGKLQNARPTAERLAIIVRKAQKNFHFATIYEQRKTNQLLYQGFRSLGDAIYSMGSEISSSLDGLSNKLNVSLNDLLDSSREQNRIMSEHNADMERYAENLKSLSEREASFRRKFEKESLHKQDKQDIKLDNIQRGRKPSI